MMTIFIFIAIIIFIWLLYSKNIEITVFRSYIQKETTLIQDLFSYVILSTILSPYSLFKLIKNKKIKKMNTKQIRNLVIIAFLSVTLVYLSSAFITTNNTDKSLRNTFTAKMSERTTFYDKMWKIISQKSQIAIKNDSSFQHIVNLQITGQKSGENAMWTWVQQSNPTATFTEVSSLYRELGQAIEAERNGFFEQEKVLQSIKLQHDNLCDMFPGSLIMSILGREKLKYVPITSDLTENVIKTGKDNNINLFK